MLSFSSFVTFACVLASVFAQSCSKTKACPLNACCSAYGNCGYGPDFCGSGCLSNCGPINTPSCSPNSNTAARLRVGYYVSWADNRDCDSMSISSINANLWTHINFAFAIIDQSTFKISPSSDYDLTLYPQLMALKKKNPNLKVFIAVGGGAVGGKAFSNMAATSSNRAAFVSSVVQYLQTYGFDGLDIDWEYPVSTDTQGSPADYANFVSLVKELRAAIGNAGMTVTIPATYYYMQYYDLKAMEPYVNWFNVMAYDLQGTWSPAVYGHTNLTDIDAGVQSLWSAGISASKVVLGTAFYGRSFTLANPSCNKPGCPFSAGGVGNCAMSGGLSLNEALRISASQGIVPTLDKTAGVKYMTYSNNQWISFDDKDTLLLKTQYANKLCMGGMMTWSVDLDTPDQVGAQALGGGVAPGGGSSSMSTSSTTTSSTTTSKPSTTPQSTPATTSKPTTSSTTTTSTTPTTTKTTTSSSTTSSTTTTTSTTQAMRVSTVTVTTTTTTPSGTTTTTKATGTTTTTVATTTIATTTVATTTTVTQTPTSSTTTTTTSSIVTTKPSGVTAIRYPPKVNAKSLDGGNAFAVNGVVASPTTSASPTCVTTACPGPPPAAATPSNVVSDCDGWAVAEDGDTCASIGAQFELTARRFRKWNGLTSSQCEALPAGNAYCVTRED